MDFDETASRRLLQTYLTPDIVGQRHLVLAAVRPTPGERVLDIGSGPGLLAGELAATVGPEGAVEGIDVSESMLAIAREQPRAADSAPTRFTAADALRLPFADETFDAAVCTQVYEYVADIPAALAQARRVLRPGGRLAILDTDWDSVVWHSSDRALMLRVMGAWDEHLADPYLPRRLPRELADAGFGELRAEVLPMFNRGYRTDTFSAGLLEMIAGFVAGRGGVTRDEAEAWAADLRRLGEDYFFSLNRYLFVAWRTL
jgi:ubiquinone/menaquinone biosynthesis C-methylase UbiE